MPDLLQLVKLHRNFISKPSILRRCRCFTAYYLGGKEYKFKYFIFFSLKNYLKYLTFSHATHANDMSVCGGIMQQPATDKCKWYMQVNMKFSPATCKVAANNNWMLKKKMNIFLGRLMWFGYLACNWDGIQCIGRERQQKNSEMTKAKKKK